MTKMNFKNVVMVATVFSLSLSGCTEMDKLLNSNEPTATPITYSQQEANLSFAQYLTHIANNKSVPPSFDMRYKSGRYGIMRFNIKPNSNYSEAYIGWDNDYYQDEMIANNEAVDMLANFKKQLQKEKISFNDKAIKNCSLPDMEILNPRHIYQATVNNKILYVVYSANAGGTGGGATASIRIFNQLPQCSYIQKLNDDI